MKQRIEAALPDCHADWRQRARIDTTALAWEASPSDLAGALRDEDGVLGAGGWLRYPPGDAGALRSDAGCQLYVRVGGLRGQE